MKVLLIDDEPIALQTMKNIIVNSEYHDFTIFTANTAITAWKIITEKSPDIIFTDIQMPCENGISLLKKIHDNHLDIPLIFVSGYSEFSYAQSALRYDAFDYILKPLNHNDFISCLKKAVNFIHTRESNQKQKEMLSKFFKENQLLLKKQFMETLLINPISHFSPEVIHQYVSLGLNPDTFCLIGIKCNTNNRMNILQNQEYFISYSISDRINKKYEDLASCYIGNVVYILMPLTDEDETDTIITLAQSLIQYAKEKLFSSITVGISEISHSIQHISKLNKQIQYCFSYSNSNDLLSDDNILFFTEINDYNSNIIEINEIISHLISAIQTRNLPESLEISKSFFSMIQNENILTQKDAIKLVELNLHSHLKDALENPLDIDYLTTPITKNCLENPCSTASITIFNNCIKNIIQELSSITSRNSSIITNAVIEFINNNYEKQISLSDVSDHINRNSSYISRILKKELSMGFSQLLTERRITAAKKLLVNTTMKISDISDKVGYTSTKYFNQVFFNHMQITPTDYRTIMKHF